MFEKILYDIILTVLVPALFGLLGISIKYGVPFLVLKLADSKLAFALTWIDKMVKAAEQKWTESGMGETKKKFVSTIVNKILYLLKIDFTEDEVDALIEASVKELNSTVTTAITTAASTVINSTAETKTN